MTTQLEDAYSVPLDKIDVSDPQLYQKDTYYPYFERLRREAPVHWCRESRYGPYWSVCKYKDIMQVEVNHQTYSSEVGGIAVEDQPKGLERESFIRMDPPKHDEQRKVVGPIVAPANLAEMESTIRERTIRVLEGLPRHGGRWPRLERSSRRPERSTTCRPEPARRTSARWRRRSAPRCRRSGSTISAA